MQILGFVLGGDTPRSLGSRTRLWTGSKLQVHAATTPHQPPHHHFIPPTVAARPYRLWVKLAPPTPSRRVKFTSAPCRYLPLATRSTPLRVLVRR